MNDQCDRFRLQLAPALFGDLDERERADLQSHLDVCPDCRAEKAELEQTLGVLQSTQDVEVPRHFFVYDSGLFWSPLGWLQQLSRVGKGAVLMAVGAVLLAVGLALSEVQIRVKEGAVTLAFGQLPPEQPKFDPEAFRAELVSVFDERLRSGEQAWLGQVRAEMETAVRSVSEQQQARLQVALRTVEQQFAERLHGESVAWGRELGNSVKQVFRVLTRQHQLDMGTLSDRLDLIQVSHQIQGSQRDALVSTLIQYADLRLQQPQQSP